MCVCVVAACVCAPFVVFFFLVVLTIFEYHVENFAGYYENREMLLMFMRQQGEIMIGKISRFCLFICFFVCH